MSLKSKLKAAVQKVEKTVHDAGVSIKKETIKAEKKVVSVAKKVITKAADIPLAPLLPLKPAMVRALDIKGVQHTNDLSDIVPKFFHRIIKAETFEDSRHEFFSGRIGTLKHVNDYNIYNNKEEHIVAEVVDIAIQLIPKVVEYFKNLKKKKDAGTITPDEQKVLDTAEETAKQIEDAGGVEETMADKIKGFLFSPGGIITILIVIGGLYLFFKKK